MAKLADVLLGRPIGVAGEPSGAPSKKTMGVGSNPTSGAYFKKEGIMCKNCKFWINNTGGEFGNCSNQDVLSFIEMYLNNCEAAFETPYNFNCKYFKKEKK